jgi:hypothetical protein
VGPVAGVEPDGLERACVEQGVHPLGRPPPYSSA